MQNPLDWGYLTAPIGQTPTWGPFSIAFVAIFAVGLVATIALYNDIPRRLRKNRLLHDKVHRGAAMLMPVFAIGLFFFAFRILRVSAFYMSLRLWIYLAFLAAVALGAYFIYYMVKIYPQAVANEKAYQLKRRYLEPSPSASSVSRSKRNSRRRKRARAGYRSSQSSTKGERTAR